jgi:hypothetical protein
MKKITGKTSMEMPGESEKAVDVSAPQKTSNEIVRLVRKLRWVGLEEEAAHLLKELEQRPATAVDTVLASPRDTD